MSTEYLQSRTDLDEEQHGDAKEVNDLVNALVDKDGNAAKEAVEAVMALAGNALEADRFAHLYKVFTAVLSNQLQARYMEPPQA